MIGMEGFFTSDKAEEGILLPLYLPDGRKSEHWLKIRGVDSREFRIAETLAKRKAVIASQIEDDTKRAEAALDARIALASTLVIAWSFEEELTEKAVIEFFKKAPQIVDAVDRISGDRSLFFALSSQNSTTGSSEKLS